MNEAVLQAIEEHVLTPEAIEQVIQLTERDDARDRKNLLERERKDVTKRIARLVAAVENGDGITSLTAKLRELETRLVAIDSDLRGLRPLPRLPKPMVETHLEEWRRLLRGSTMQSRAVIQRTVEGRITFTPRADGQGYDFVARTRFDKLFSGVALPKPTWIPNDTFGTKHIGPADTPDSDYGALLAAALATRNGWRARQDSNLRPPA